MSLPPRLQDMDSEPVEPSIWYLACDIILKDGISSLDRKKEEVLADSGWTAAVVFMATELILAPGVLAGKWDNENRRMLRMILTGEHTNSSIFGKIVEPLLYNDEINGVSWESHANAAASDYKYKLINLLHTLHAMGPNASPEFILDVNRLDYERSLMLWVEWHIICSFPDENVRTSFINHVFRVGIPLMYNKERLGDPWGKRFRENYCYMVKEFTGCSVCQPLIEQLWNDWIQRLADQATTRE